jgi:prepilin-type N-terminal cleavage/methylation domain-containing protein
MKAQRGFTLIELLMVLMIGAIVLMWALPNIDVAEMRVRSAEQQLSTTVLAAQQRAVMKQHDVRVLFDTAGRRVVLHDDENNNGTRDANEPERTLELTEGVQFTTESSPSPTAPAVTFAAGAEGWPVLTFHRGGFGSESGSVYLGTARSARGERPADARQLEVERATGRVTRHYVAGGIWRTHQS